MMWLLFGILFFLFCALMMLAVVEGGKESEYRCPPHQFKKWVEHAVPVDTIISIEGIVTKINGSIVSLDDNVICKFKAMPDVKNGDRIIVSGYVLVNERELCLCDSRVLAFLRF